MEAFWVSVPIMCLTEVVGFHGKMTPQDTWQIQLNTLRLLTKQKRKVHMRLAIILICLDYKSLAGVWIFFIFSLLCLIYPLIKLKCCWDELEEGCEVQREIM